MCNEYIFRKKGQVQRTILKQTYSNKFLSNQKCSASVSKQYGSTHSLPTVSKEILSFKQFIAGEKYNLQAFPSFREARRRIDNEKDKKIVIKNHHLWPCNIANNFHSLSNNSKVVDDERTVTCMM
jgi:hypothetical protein